MTKTAARAALALLAGLLAAAALAPAASAHGAPPVRDIDARVLLDDDGLPGYGGCAEGACPPGAGGGLDLLALDVREASFPDGEAAVIFRILYQSEDPVGSSVTLAVESPGGAKEFGAATADGLAFTATGFDRLDGPFDVGDGHPKAIDGWVRASALGAKAGDALSGIALASFRGEAQDDAMPGGWFSNGVEVPVVPAEPDPGALDGAEPGSYTLAGPALLLTMTANGTAMPTHTPAKVGVVLVNPVSVEQFANLTVTAPGGVTVRLSLANVLLQPTATRTVELTVSNATMDGVIEVVATTDLGGRAVALVPVRAPPQGHMQHMGGNSTGNGTSSDPDSKKSPGAGLLVLPALAVAAVVLRRRR